MKTTTHHAVQYVGRDTLHDVLKFLLAKPLLVCTFCITHLLATAQVFWQDNFENATTPDIAVGSTRTASMNQGTTLPSISYFKRSTNTTTDISLSSTFGTTYAGMSGSNIWAGENHDAAGGTENGLNPVQTIEWTNINITGKSGILFKGLFAANHTNGSWDNGVNTGGSDPVGIASGSNDYILVEYAINTGSYQTLILFMGDNVIGSKLLKEDTNNDGLGDGTSLNNTLQEFTKNITGTGTTMKIRLTVRSNGSNEEWATDNLRLATAVLPVELIQFTVNTEGGKNKLIWTTANEINSYSFEVERSSDGKDFTQIGTVKAQGKAATYNFIDNQPINGTTYYRLNQTDNDQSSAYSKVISVQTKEKGLKVYPTLVSNGFLTIVIARDEATGGGDYSIFNIVGQQVQSGQTTQRLDVSALAKGTYILKVGTEQVKFTKL